MNSDVLARLGKETQRIRVDMTGSGIEWKRDGCANLGTAKLRHGNDVIGMAKSGDGTEKSSDGTVLHGTAREPKRVDTPWYGREMTCIGITRRSGGRDMQSFAGVVFCNDLQRQSIAKNSCGRAKTSIGKDVQRLATAMH